MLEYFIHTDNGQIYYQKYGKGPKAIIALHGFGQSGRYFKNLETHIGHSCTIYAIDLPFHGQSKWDQTSFSKRDITNIINQLIHKYQLNKFTFLGHSFGARIISATLEIFSSNIEAVFLLAPDGFGTRWLRLPQLVPSFLRHWLQKRLQNPNRLLTLAKRLYHLHLIAPFVLKYLQYNLGEEKRRQRLFWTWNTLAQFKIQTNVLKKSIQKEEYPFTIILGEKDFLIPERKIRRNFGKMQNIEIHSLPTSHFLDAKKISQILNTYFQAKD